jgi:probable HAF family extracellular repeat protein
MRHGRLSRIAGTALLALLAVPFMGRAQEQAQEHAKKHTRYTLVDIGTLGGPNSALNGGGVVANRSGTVVGRADTSIFDPACDCYVSHAFRWRKGALTDLGTLPGGTNSVAAAINSQGAVAGFSENGLIDPVYGIPAFVATIWKDGDIEDLGTLGGGLSLPNAINDRGQAVGAAANSIADPDGFGTVLIFDVAIPGNQWHATLWQKGAIEDLGTLGDGLDSFAFAVNEGGQVAGNSYTDSIPTVFGIPTVHPFFWEEGRGMVDVGTLGGVYSTATGLNNRSQVAGFSTLTGDLTQHAFLWDQEGIKDLGTLGGSSSETFALNDRGEVVGRSLMVGDQALHAFLWKHGAMTDLGALAGDTFSQALSINAAGQIVGQSFNDDGSDVFRACLWDNGDPPIDLDVFVPPGSDLHLHEPLFISDRGEIVGKALLPNGDAHVFVLIPRDSDGDDLVDEAPNEARAHAPSERAAASAANAALIPEVKAALRARLAPRYRGFGSLLRKPTH